MANFISGKDDDDEVVIINIDDVSYISIDSDMEATIYFISDPDNTVEISGPIVKLLLYHFGVEAAPADR